MDDLLRWRVLPLLVLIASSLVLYLRSNPKKSVTECSLLLHDHYWITSKRVVTPRGVIEGAVEVKEGKIISVIETDNQKGWTDGGKVVDFGEAVIMPGLIDIHVHLDEPGRVEWEGFSSGTKAAASGFWGGLVPENAYNITMLDGLLHAGALGLKFQV